MLAILVVAECVFSVPSRAFAEKNLLSQSNTELRLRSQSMNNDSLLYTVDYHYNDRCYVSEGNSRTPLSDILEALQIPGGGYKRR